MALVAMFDEHRTDLLFEESDASRVVGGHEGSRDKQEEDKEASHARIGLMT
jgi:hypothetical protein